MKKFFALLLTLCMLLPAVVACRDNTETSSSESSSNVSQSQSQSTPDNPDTPGNPDNPDNPGYTDDQKEKFSSKETILDAWSGKTLNVLATRYGETAGAPWGQLELAPEKFGVAFEKAQANRQAKIKELYGVDVKWIDAMAAQTIIGDLTTALTSKDTHYEIALPRAHEVQSLVQNGAVLDLAQSDYLTFTQNDYFSNAAYEAFTVGGRTMFAAGGHDFSDDQTAYVLFYNKELAATYKIDDLYSAVKSGDWTFDTLRNLSRAVKKDDGNGVQGDEDTYGFATKNVGRFFSYAGIFEARVDPDLGEYTVTLNNEPARVKKVVANIIDVVKGTDWARQGQDGSGVNGWGGSWGGNSTVAFNEKRVLFFEEVAQQIDNMGSIEFALGVLPFPKLDKEQTRYYTTTTSVQTTFICAPQCTADKDMSFYFIDVLSWTGNDYIIKEYQNKIAAAVEGEEDLAIFNDYVLANIVYDAGAITAGWNSLLGDVIGKCYANGTDSFTELYDQNQEQAKLTVGSWNDAWKGYFEIIQ